MTEKEWEFREDYSEEEMCGNCRYWQMVRRPPQGVHVEAEGICRRRSPVAMASATVEGDGTNADGTIGRSALWPRTFSDSDWCGDFVARPDDDGA